MKKIRETRGDFTINGAITLLLVSLLLVFGMSAIGTANRAAALNTLADEVVRYIEVRGRVDDAVYTEIARLEDASGLDCTSEIDADYMGGSGKIQFGNAVTVRMTHIVYFGAGGIVRLPITLTSQAEGRSERYWK